MKNYLQEVSFTTEYRALLSFRAGTQDLDIRCFC